MKQSRGAALGGRHQIAVSIAVGVLVAALTGVVTQEPAHGVDPIDTPITGLLPVCAGNLHETISQDVWVEADGTDPFDAAHEGGLRDNCAWQNMQDRSNSSLWPRAAQFKAEPDTVSISDVPTTIRFDAIGGAAPGPFNATLPDCMPLSLRAGGCGDNTEDPTPYVAYRLANGAGFFSGRWTLVSEASDNPYFDLTRNTLSCADRYPNWDNEHQGLPCDYELRFATAPGGAPVLTSAMQVVVGIRWLYGEKTANGHTGQEYGYTAMVPMLFTPGSSTSLKLASLSSPVPFGSAVALRSTAVGPPAGTQVNFYRRAANGTVAAAGQALTDASGVATLNVTATGNAEYWSRLVSGGSETAQSETRALTVTRGVTLAAKKKGKSKYELTAKLDPGTGAGQVQLQRFDKKKGWVTEKTGTPAASLSWVLKPPKGKSAWRVLLPASVDFASSVSNEVKAKRKKKK